MKTTLLFCALAGVTATAAPGSTGAEPSPRTMSSFESWASGRLRLGARAGSFALDEGSVRAPGAPAGGPGWRMAEESDVLPSLYAQYTLCPHGYGGLGLGCERLEVSVSDPSAGEPAAVGELEAWGATAYVFSQLPNRTRFTPFAEAGVAGYFADFDDAGGAAGRRLDVDDAAGWFLRLGGRADLTRHWSLELAYRRLAGADVDARLTGAADNEAGGGASFPLDHDSLSAGLSHRF